MRIQEGVYAWSNTIIFSADLTRRAMAGMAVRQGGYPMPQGPAVFYDTVGANDSLCFWMNMPRALHSFLQRSKGEADRVSKCR